jgi:hypothetical protein
MRVRVASLIGLLWLTSTSAVAQQTRADLLEQQRAERAQALSTYQPGKVEQGLLFVEQNRVIERIKAGFGGLYPRVGGFTTGSGFAFGVGIRRRLGGLPIIGDASGAFSMKGYKALDVALGSTPLVGGRLELAAALHWWDYPRERYYGLGPNSSGDDRTSYRYEATHWLAHARIRPLPWLSFGDETGYLRPTIEAGTDSRFPSIDEVFTDATAPGLERPPRLVYTRLIADLDYRDQPGNTRSGGRYLVTWGLGRDRNPGHEFDYERTDVTLEQVVSFFDKKRNFAFRVVGAHVVPRTPDGRVPFFLAPTIGGGNSLRSYDDNRFRDATFLLANVEYRWEAFAGLDLALFADAGDVGMRLRDIRAGDVKTGWGFGLRFNTNRSVFLRLDVGYGGPAGTRVLWKFGPAF